MGGYGAAWLRFLRKVRVALTARDALLTTRLPGGAVIAGRNRAGWGGRGIYVMRREIEPEVAHLDELLAPGDVFVDVGASTGVYTVLAARRVGVGGRVVALEPYPEVFAMLEHNVRANRLTNVHLHNLCAAASAGRRELWLNFARPSLFGLVRRDPSARALAVNAVALDDLVRAEGLARLDYLKIDAEGAESEILAGAAATIQTLRPIVQLEQGDWKFDIAGLGYCAFRAAGSVNVVHFPLEHPRIGVPARLGWTRP